MQVHVRHEGTLGELVRRQPAFARLQHARIAAQDWRYWRRNDGASHSHDLQVVFLGKSGYGKSSLVNALSGLPAMATSDVEACTRVAQSVEYAIRPGNFLSLADLLAPHPWLVDDEGRLLGHVLTVDDRAFEKHDGLWGGSLAEALEQPWADAHAQAAWARAYARVLRTLADDAVDRAEAAQRREALRRAVDDDREG